MYLYAIYLKKPPFFAKKSVSNFFGSQSGKIKLIFLIYTFFRTSVQKIGDGLFIFFFSKGFGLADIRPYIVNQLPFSTLSKILHSIEVAKLIR